MAIDYLEKILNARVYGAAVETPLDRAAILSERLGNTLLFKREDLQRTNSFKMRGAFNKIASLSPEALAIGVITASSGNHAQGVAYGAKVKGCRAVIVMPVSTPAIKVDAVRALGGEVVQYGDSFTDSLGHALELEKTEGLSFVHPYDDPEVIAGQGTIGMEILRQCQEPIHAVFIAIGGGGMIAGIGAYLKRLRPETRIIGVQPVDSDAMKRSLETGERVLLPHVGLFADGVAVRQVGEETFRVAREVIDEIMLIDTDAMCTAMREVFAENRAILEPSAALTVAAAKDYVAREGIRDQVLVSVLCGANMNFDRLGFVVERSYAGEHREALLGITVPRTPGSVRRLIDTIGEHRFSEFGYRLGDAEAAQVFAGIYVSGREDTAATIGALEAAGFATTDLSDNELAKTHLRHLAGGRSPAAGQEQLYSFEFPETPGAFGAFLSRMRSDWTVSLFHYRNHGADHGSVLMGVQVPPGDEPAFRAFIEERGYPFVEETDNPAYRMFLR
ncbi:threonine ammonia-lyase, biosynthetic [Amaricoccus sp.]|uniref:threonine ammonia-lyase, biosynthetic n=1 Tax=Amaricoccus sp. TaxID=1872485 RepID=UPI001B745C31|nr:threonine ammonia-lyase, biosynthetic [Amaricoccus sp.]MBP7002155.1 threonine ammonia-lyase, biosynthetic [Amaricoccus sp.]